MDEERALILVENVILGDLHTCSVQAGDARSLRLLGCRPPQRARYQATNERFQLSEERRGGAGCGTTAVGDEVIVSCEPVSARVVEADSRQVTVEWPWG